MFDTASHLEPLAPGRYAAAADERWLQGRGHYGGLVAAWCVRAVEHHVGDPDRRLRSATFHLAAPCPPGPATIEVETTRAGAYVSQVTGRVVAGGSVVATVQATLARDRRDALLIAPAPPPTVPPPDRVPSIPWHPVMPAFARLVDYRFALGAPPFSGARPAELGGWGRFRDPATPDAALVTAMLDAWPPAPFAGLDRHRPAATVDWTVHLLEPIAPDTPRDAWFLFHGACTWADAGYAEEVGSLWGPDGRLLGRMRQLIALLPTAPRS